MLDKTDDRKGWCEVRISTDNPNFDRIENRKGGKMGRLCDLVDELWDADLDLGRVEDCEHPHEVMELIDDAQAKLREVRYKLTLRLGDEPDDLLWRYVSMNYPKQELALD